MITCGMPGRIQGEIHREMHLDEIEILLKKNRDKKH
jgi:hypothetical protein